jgi:hypothetical protein
MRKISLQCNGYGVVVPLLKRPLQKRIGVTFVVWDKDKKFSRDDLDPNFLIRPHFKKSIFHQSLHRFVVEN